MLLLLFGPTGSHFGAESMEIIFKITKVDLVIDLKHNSHTVIMHPPPLPLISCGGGVFYLSYSYSYLTSERFAQSY